ncbi:transposase [Sagittula sp. NFXS13]|uniref:transposase n=1 Tax=Sagittula sp. NFXS13 TaxID=2819095 RepID=UPI0032DF2A50
MHEANLRHDTKSSFDGPEAVLAYLSLYTHRLAIPNSRLVSADVVTVAFRWKDCLVKSGDRSSIMRLATPEFIRRFLIHVLPDAVEPIWHYGLLASAIRTANIFRIRALLSIQKPEPPNKPEPEAEITVREPCPCCGGPMRIIEIFRHGQEPMSRALP